MQLNITSIKTYKNYLYSVPPIFYNLKNNVSTGSLTTFKQAFDNKYKKLKGNTSTPLNIYSLDSFNISLFKSSDGVIRGTVTENGKVLPNCQVYLYQSSTGLLADRSVSNSEGEFMFIDILQDVRYFILATDKNKMYNITAIDGIVLSSLGNGYG